VAFLRGIFLSRTHSSHMSAKYLRKQFSAIPPTGSGYVDNWFREVIKSKTFYERHALEHRYFYNIDLEGRLYLEETYPKNIATSFKNEKFLNFFFRRLRYANEEDWARLGDDDLVVRGDYPFVSPCGRELNYVRPVDTPIVFHNIRSTSNTQSKDQLELVFGASLCQPFQPDSLYFSKQNYRIYHSIKRNEIGDNEPGQEKEIEFGLLSSSMVMSLSNKFQSSSCGEIMEFIAKDGSIHIMKELSTDHDNGSWGMR